ncbi:MAG: hypothetical protein NTX82_04015 [Candidatus Parcubacteria bacterium]|nr:hypothetical protein [Candidatus Parcubacteria bacterium]
MSEQQKKEKQPKLGKVTCPRCNHPMIPKSSPGFGCSDKMVCSNPVCPSNQPTRGWGS